MAGILESIDNILGTRLGLLVSDPRAAMQQMNQQAGAFNQASLLATQAERNAMRGRPVTQEQAAAKQYVDKVNEDLAMGFAGTTAQKNIFNVTKSDASNIFGEGAKRVRYTEPNTGGTIDVLLKKDGTASVLELFVPEQFRGMGVGKSLQQKILQDFPEMQGQVSSKAAAKTAYDIGRRPVNQPNATLNDIFNAIDEYSSINLVSPRMQERFKK